MSIWLILVIAEISAGWLGYQLGRDRGQWDMENKRGIRRQS